MIDPTRLANAVAFAAELTPPRSANGHQVISAPSHTSAPSLLSPDSSSKTAGTPTKPAPVSYTTTSKTSTLTAADARAAVGPIVCNLVAACTGPKKEVIPDFRSRNSSTSMPLLAERSGAAVRVSLADKVHNARATANDLGTDAPSMWQRFNAPAVDQLWWYSDLVVAHRQHADAGRADVARVAELGRRRDMKPDTKCRLSGCSGAINDAETPHKIG